MCVRGSTRGGLYFNAALWVTILSPGAGEGWKRVCLRYWRSFFWRVAVDFVKVNFVIVLRFERQFSRINKSWNNFQKIRRGNLITILNRF